MAGAGWSFVVDARGFEFVNHAREWRPGKSIGPRLTLTCSARIVKVYVRFEPRLLREGTLAIASLLDGNGYLVEDRLDVAGIDATGALNWLEHSVERIVHDKDLSRIVGLIGAAKSIDWEERAWREGLLRRR